MCIRDRSTPSVYFCLTDENIKKQSYVFDIDKKFASDPNFVYYDFSKPEDIPQNLENYFDLVLIDPPFITRDVWSKYTEAIKKLVTKDADGNITGKLLLSSILENETMLSELLNVKKREFKPSIPNLIYQYNFYSNYESETLSKLNPEVDFQIYERSLLVYILSLIHI
eukprot:TRINITY_DN31062_c0_g2_i1.p1 TRINITY_DN31062_c0_g2~~TRINITY_DN31062_c0_g2_i1.p1  ORF type:complete len:184 (-),score=47.57 TRINITY_DN31062_c0_g2_i1:60-563(-)